MKIERWPGSAVGRSRIVAYGDIVWTVSNARTLEADFDTQIDETLKYLDDALAEAGSSRTGLTCVQVILTDISNREAFDEKWCHWIGPDPQHWPQRAVIGGALAPGLLLEVIATAVRGKDYGSLRP